MPSTVTSLPVPESEQELYRRATALAGYTMKALADAAGLPIPNDLKRDKGWVGMLLEHYLGASAGSKPEQDFPHLGIELKTIPVSQQGNPLETTFVCVAPLTNNSGVTQKAAIFEKSCKEYYGFPSREKGIFLWLSAVSVQPYCGARMQKKKCS